MKSNIKYGHELIKYFQLEENYLNLNSGSFGTTPKYILQKYREYQDMMENNPDKWIRYNLNDRLNEVRGLVAKYINADSSNVVLIQNATDGINTILKSMLKNKGDNVLMFNISYGASKNTAKYLSDTIGICVVEVNLDEDDLNSDDKILEKIKSVVEKHSNIKLANIDHISSAPAIVLPVSRIIDLLRKYEIPIFIDGAHTAGHIPLNMKELDPDFYISNFHKWGFNAKSCCFLYVSPKFQKIIHPNTISNSYGNGFVNDFSYAGCKDYSSFLTIKDALEFRNILGENEIMAYNRNLAVKAADLISKIWGTELLNKDLKSCAMFNVRIPFEDSEIIEKCVKIALFEYNFSIKAFKFDNGKFYARFSCQIFNEIEDYKCAAEKFLVILNNLEVKKVSKSKF